MGDDEGSPVIMRAAHRRRQKVSPAENVHVEDVESQIIIPGTPQKPSKRKLFKSNNCHRQMDKMKERKEPASWAMDINLPPINLSPHKPSTPPAWMKSSPYRYSFDHHSSDDDDDDSQIAPESQSLLALAQADDPEMTQLMKPGAKK